MSNRKKDRRHRGFSITLPRINRNLVMAGSAVLALFIAVVGVSGSLLAAGEGGRSLIVEPEAAVEQTAKKETRVKDETASVVLAASVDSDDDIIVVSDPDNEGPLQPVQPLQPVSSNEIVVVSDPSDNEGPLQPVQPLQPVTSAASAPSASVTQPVRSPSLSA